MTGVVLAGGESRRMGTDKAFLKVNGMPMVERVIGTLRSVCDHIIVVTNSPEPYARMGVDVTADAFSDRGALVGIYSGLLRSRSDRSMVVACDMPFLNAALIEYMTRVAGEYDVVLPRVGEFIEPLHAVYRKALLPVIEYHLRSDRRRIRDIFPGLRIRHITEDEIDRFDPARRSFLNLNTRKEYEEVTCSDLECRN